jgi:hypothetical protein
MSVRRTVTRSREPALSEAEGDPTPVDIQQRPDRESSEISVFGCPVAPRTILGPDNPVHQSDEMTLPAASENASVPMA